MAPQQEEMCATKPARTAGRTTTCAAYQRVNVNAPTSAPPRIIDATHSPASGVSFEMLIETTVAQYARWSHGSR